MITLKKTLQVGSYGEEVTILQTKLTELGYFKAKIDGSFGRTTDDAVKLFQSHMGLKSTGIVASIDWTRLFVYCNLRDEQLRLKEIENYKAQFPQGEPEAPITELKTEINQNTETLGITGATGFADVTTSKKKNK